MKLFGLKDNVSNRFISVTLAETEQMYVRTALYPILMDYPLKDISFFCLGDFDPDLGIIKPCVPRLCSWDCYKFPESRANKEKYLTLEQIEEQAKNKKHEFLKKTKDNIFDLENAMKQAKAQLKLEEEKKGKEKNKKRIMELREIINEISLEIKKLKEVV